MKYLFVGDLHTKNGILERVKELSEGYDKVIFLGDYVDDWMSAPEYSKQLLENLIDFKLSNPGKVILLLGNHDLSEWFGKPFACSGYNFMTSQLISPLFTKYEELFDIAFVPKDRSFICSHAGFTKSWLNKYFQKPFESPWDIMKVTNYAFHHRKQENCEDAFFGLGDVGYARGGHQDPSPLWADTVELIADWFPVIQIVGHTPHQTVTFYNNYDEEIYFCDTFSTYSDYSPYGDDSLLTLEDKNFVKISLDGKELPW